MSAGDDSGDVGAGDDAIAALSGPRNVTAPVALHFDGATRDFLMDDDGRYRSIHPVDQAVALSLLTEASKLIAVPGLGARFRSIRNTSGSRTRAEVEDAVRIALASRLAAGDIRILGIEHESPSRHALFAEVRYLNLRLNPPVEQRAPF